MTVIQLATTEHVVKLKELRNERAPAQTDVTRKCKLQAFIVQPAW